MRFVVRVKGIRGYGITYGVIDPIPFNEIECATDRLGEIVLYALKKLFNTMGRLNTICKNKR